MLYVRSNSDARFCRKTEQEQEERTQKVYSVTEDPEMRVEQETEEVEGAQQETEGAGAERGKKLHAVSQMKVLFDQTTVRSRKRSQQMMRIRSNRESKSVEEFVNILCVAAEEERKADIPVNQMTDQITHQMTDQMTDQRDQTSSVMNNNKINTVVPVCSTVVTNAAEEQFLECDLDCVLERETAGESTRSFVAIKNKLVNHNRGDNSTASYLLALQQYDNHAEQEQEEREEQSPNKDSLEVVVAVEGLEAETETEAEGEEMKHLQRPEKLQSQSTREVKHVRLPSGTNFLINSVIEEEVSEMYTDSGLSHRRKSAVFAMSSRRGEGIEEIGEEREMMLIEDNTDKRHTLFGGVKRGHKIAKSEMFHLQLDLKNTFDSMSTKKTKTDLTSRNKIENMKKQLVDQFFQSYTKKSEVKARYENVVEVVNEDSFDMLLKSPLKQEPYEVDSVAISASASASGPGFDFGSVAVESKNLKELYKRERHNKKSSIFKSEDLRVGKAESMQPTIKNNSNNNNNNNRDRDRVFGDSSDKQYININNNFHICSPISVISNSREDAERLTLNLLTSLNEISSAMNMVVAGNMVNNLAVSNKRPLMAAEGEEEDEKETARVNKKLFHPVRHENLSIVSPIQLDILPKVISRRPSIISVASMANKQTQNSSYRVEVSIAGKKLSYPKSSRHLKSPSVYTWGGNNSDRNSGSSNENSRNKSSVRTDNRSRSNSGNNIKNTQTKTNNKTEGVAVKNKVPKIPPSSSCCTVGNKTRVSTANKTVTADALKVFVFPKNLDHYKNTCAKLNSSVSKGGYLIWMKLEKDKTEFKGLYQMSSSKEFLLKLYAVTTLPNVISLNDISSFYSLNKDTLTKQDTCKSDSVAFTLVNKK